MPRVMSLSSLGGDITAGRESGLKALLKMRGTGLPPVSTQWFEGAGDGATYRSARVLARVMDLSVKVYGADREAVSERMSAVGRIFAPSDEGVKVAVQLDGETWYTFVHRTGGGDWDWSSDTDGKTFIITTITVKAGDPFWTRNDMEARAIVPGGLGRGLIKATSLSKLELSTNTAFGTVEFINSGDVPAYGRWTVRAPFTGFEFISPDGAVLKWTGEKLTGYLTVDTELGVIADEAGANRYTGLDAVPRFWAIPQGTSSASVVAFDAIAPDTQIEVIWKVKKWVMF